VIDDPAAWEILRVWIAHRKQHVSIKPFWNDYATWGIVIVDIIRHLGDAYHKSHGIDPAETTARIMAAVRAEFDYPTDNAKGDFVDGSTK
jgi:hypothetical protein